MNSKIIDFPALRPLIDERLPRKNESPEDKEVPFFEILSSGVIIPRSGTYNGSLISLLGADKTKRLWAAGYSRDFAYRLLQIGFQTPSSVDFPSIVSAERSITEKGLLGKVGEDGALSKVIFWRVVSAERPLVLEELSYSLGIKVSPKVKIEDGVGPFRI